VKTVVMMWASVCGATLALTGCFETMLDCEADSDGDGLGDCQEQDELGTDPQAVDTDGDGLSDADEVDCGSDPLDEEQYCYACGWSHDDPGDLVSSGADEGDVVQNLSLEDQCEELVQLWDFAGAYHILWMTAAW
jgi:hypothetical protein